MGGAALCSRATVAAAGRLTARRPAVYVRAADLGVDRLEQRYRRIADEGDRQRFEYAAPAFGFTARLVYDRHGLLLDHPGIAVRAA